MTTRSLRNLRRAAGAGWLVLVASAVRSLLVDDGDNWELPYNAFALALFVAVALTVVVLWVSTQDADRPRLRAAGLAVTALGVAGSFLVAWALPLWMTLLGAGFAVLAASSPAPQRRAVGLLAAAQLAGIAVQFGALGLGVREDPASDVAVLVTAAAMALVLWSGFGDRGEPLRVVAASAGAYDERGLPTSQ